MKLFNWGFALLALSLSVARANLVISEIMYNPVGGENYEYVEIHNAGTVAVDLKDHFMNDAVDYTFLVSYILPAGGYVVLVDDEDAFAALYPGVTNVAPGSFSGKLKNEGETISLRDDNGLVIFTVTYSHLSPWPADANGNGSSLVLLDPQALGDDVRNWGASVELHGSPGRAGDSLVKDIVINEVLTHTDLPYEDAIELFNTTTNAIDIGGWFLSDANLTRNKYRIPTNTVLQAGGYIVFYEYQFGDTNALANPFSLSSNGDQVYLTEADAGGTLLRTADVVKFGAVENGISLGRFPTYDNDVTRLQLPSFGSAVPPASNAVFRAGTGALNAPPIIGPVVINEIMYHPPEQVLSVDNTVDEYVELMNISGSPVELFDSAVATNTWRLSDGVDFTFPTNTTLAAGEIILIISTNDVAGFRARHNVDAGVRIFGGWTGKLDNSREGVKLRQPGNPNLDGSIPYITVDRVDYLDVSPWPGDADGLGPSLERAPAPAFGNDPRLWQDSIVGGTPGDANGAFLPVGSVVINEFMASNVSTLQDENADFSDWIELYNTTASSIDISGWYLTDDTANLALWAFPSGTVIPAESYLLVFASGKNRSISGQQLHTNFRLDETGEYLALLRQNGTSIMYEFAPTYPPQYADIAFGLGNSGAADLLMVSEGSPSRYRVPTDGSEDATWRDLGFNDAAWDVGTAAIGYDENPTYFPFFDTDLISLMLSNNPTAYLRIPFVLEENPLDISTIKLRMRFDDGFIAYLNGTQIEAENDPGGPDWQSSATGNVNDADAVIYQDFDVSTASLQAGNNVLAIHGLNTGTTSSDFLISPELVARLNTSGSATQLNYFHAATPNNGNVDGEAAVAGKPALSSPGGIFSTPFNLSITEPSGSAAIYYTLDGSDPTTNAFLYIGPIPISENTEVRARAFAAGLVASPQVSGLFRTAFLGFNEVMASNSRTWPEMFDYSDFADWIELYNDSTSPQDLSGYFLSDDLDNHFKWALPSGTIIPAKGHLLIWADGEDDVPGITIKRPFYPYNNVVSRNYHTNFRLSSDGESVGLFSPSGALVDSVTMDVQSTDVSYGRISDGHATWAYFGEATPELPNTSPSLSVNNAFAGEPEFSVAGGWFTNAFPLALSYANTNAVIRYTTDGSQPSSQSSAYVSNIVIAVTTTFRARVYEPGFHPGSILTHTYFINEPTRYLPVVALTGDPFHLFDNDLGIYDNGYKQREIPIHAEFYENGEKIFSVDAGGKVFGLNIFRFAQKPFSLFFRSKWGTELLEKQIFPEKPVAGFTRLVLRNSGDDWPETGFRDAYMQEIVRGRIDNGIQTYKPCEIYLNGEYFGMLNMREKLDETYITANYREARNGFDYYEMEGAGGSAIEQVVEGTEDEWQLLRSYVSNNDLSNQANFDFVASKVDIEDIANFVIAQTFLQNTSWFHNRKWWRPRTPDGKWRWMFFDLDRGFNISNVNGNELNDLSNNFNPFDDLLENQAFEEFFIQKYAAHLNTTFQSGRMLEMIDVFETRVEDAMVSHVARWGTRGGISSMTSWRNEINTMRAFATQRPAAMFNNVASTFNLSGGRSDIVLDHVGDGAGQILANVVVMNPGASTNEFFNGIPMTFTAVPEIGHTFDYWRIIGQESSTTNYTFLTQSNVWNYLDDGSNQFTNNWEAVDFDDSTWSNGVAQLGYGDGDEATVIGFGPNSGDKYRTSYFRKTFVVPEVPALTSLSIQLKRDDGAVVFMNGAELFRDNVPGGTLTEDTEGIVFTGEPQEHTFFTHTINPALLLPGTNVFAVSVHQASGTSSDVSFDLSLTGSYSETIALSTQIVTNAEMTFIPDSDIRLEAVFTQDLSAHVLCGSFDTNVTLTAAESPYLVSCDLIIPSNITVIVEAGVELHMIDNASIYVYGGLDMQGTPANPCMIIPNTNSNARLPLYVDHSQNAFSDPRWGGLAAHRATSPLRMSNVIIRGATTTADAINHKSAISALGTDVYLDGVDLDQVDFPIFIQEGNHVEVRNSRIHSDVVCDYINVKRAKYALVENCDLRGDSAPDTDAIDFDGLSTGIVRNTVIHDFIGFNSDAIDAGEQAMNILIESNILYNCTDKGVSVGQGSKVTVRKNLIYNVDMGVGIKDTGSYALIDQNTIHHARLGVAVFEKNFGAGGGSADVINTILSGSTNIGYFVDSKSSINISYSMSDTEVLPGVSNLFVNPYFVSIDNVDFTLQRSSQAIDSGDASSALDPDGSRADMGAFPADSTKGYVVISEIHYNPATTQGLDEQYEFVELHNPGPGAVDLTGYHFSQGLDFTFPASTTMAAGEYLVIAADAATYGGLGFQVFAYGTNTTLSNSGETLELSDSVSNQVDIVKYNDDPPWALTPDGFGPSLSLIHPWMDNNLAESWYPSHRLGGTPGGAFDNLAPNIGLALMPGSSSLVMVPTISGLLYVVEYSDSLMPASWLPLGPPIQSTGQDIMFLDPDTDGMIQRYYRVKALLR